jgi:tetratricopeptide (TPR) repeat protein
MKRLFLGFGVVCLVAVFLPACAEQPEPEPEPVVETEAPQESEKIPVTTKSETAREHYQNALVAWEKVSTAAARQMFDDAIENDPDFFMAYYRHTIFDLYFDNQERFREYAQKAVAVDVELSEGEELLKHALGRLLDDPKADVREFGEKLVERYPEDTEAYNTLGFYQMLQEDYQGAVTTFNNALPLAENPSTLYNALAYTYLALEQYDDAKAALDKYVELKPDWSNPYDSCGDYYMEVEDYEKAYESFMKAFKLGRPGSERKALKAKELMEGKKPTT